MIAAEVLTQGFAIVPDFLGPDSVRTLRQAARTLAAGGHGHHYPKSIRVWDLFRHGPQFADILTNTRLTSTLNDLLGRHHLLSDYSLNIVNPGRPIDDWHIDYPYNEMQSLLDGGILGLQCVLALDDFDTRNGATQLIPRSHRPPRRPDPSEVDSATTFEARAGDLLMMAAATWHRSGVNQTSTDRAALLLSFVPRWVRPMVDPPEPGPWAPTDALRILLGIERPPETINGVLV